MPLSEPPRPFLGAVQTPRPRVVLLGAPLDATESFQPGTAEGPQRIREVSEVLETYSPALEADLEDLPLADWGNVEWGPQPSDDAAMERALGRIAEAVSRAADVGLPILIGGEHTATLGALAALHQRHPELMVVQADAHADLRNDYEGRRITHTTVMRRAADLLGLERIAQLGIRSCTREERELARACAGFNSHLSMPEELRTRLGARPVYLTIDIDVLDPSCAPGTGCPEPGGPGFADLLDFLYALGDLNVVGMDLMEVLPRADVNDITSVAAAKLVREGALLFGRAGAASPGTTANQ